jgi:hypothetical protein
MEGQGASKTPWPVFGPVPSPCSPSSIPARRWFRAWRVLRDDPCGESTTTARGLNWRSTTYCVKPLPDGGASASAGERKEDVLTASLEAADRDRRRRDRRPVLRRQIEEEEETTSLTQVAKPGTMTNVSEP